jgi:Na+-driven multidrug efflux pump
LFRLIAPIVVEQLLAVSIGAVDMMMVSAIGEYAVSGVDIVNSINNLFVIAFDPDVMEAAALYLFVTALSYPFLAVGYACSAILRAAGNSRTSMFVTLMSNALNVFGNALLIFVFAGKPSASSTTNRR